MSDTSFNNVAFDMPKSQSNSIKVIGVGGGGSNAVNHMFSEGLNGVDFVICNTDAQALQNSPVPNKIQLGVSLTSGLGAGANPEVGEKAAEESIDEIKKILTSQTKMVFITAGMGGGTGTGAAPIIAGIAKRMDILTVGIVTMPFQFEGRMRCKQAQKGIDELRDNVDSLIVINNNKLREVYGNLGFKAGFSKADEVLSTASRGIAEVITNHYKQNIDLHDAKTVLSNSGTAIMGSSKESGDNRAQIAIMKALDSPLLNDNNIKGAKNVLLLIVSGTEEVTIDEIAEINDFIQEQAGYDANIIMGIGEDDNLGDAIAITIVATGFAVDQQKDITNTEARKVYHTLNTEQTAHYNFDKEESINVLRKTHIEEPIVEEKKVIHQLLEEEPEKTPLVESSVEAIDEVLEDDFVINDVTPLDLFSTIDEESNEIINLFDSPVVKESQEVKSKVINVFDEPVVNRKEETTEILEEDIKEEVLDILDIPVVGAEEVVERTVYSLEDNIVDEINTVNEKEVEFEPEIKVESTVDGGKRYTLNNFNIQPTINNSSSIQVKKSIPKTTVNEADEEMELKVVEKLNTKSLDTNAIIKEVTPLEPKIEVVESEVVGKPTIMLLEEDDVDEIIPPVVSEIAESEEIELKVTERPIAELLEQEKEDNISPSTATISELRKTSTLSELRKTTEKRKSTFKKYSHRFKNAAFNEENIDDIEKQPAYKRLGLELHSKEDVSNISRTSVGTSDDNEVTIRKNNSFLHDNVD